MWKKDETPPQTYTPQADASPRTERSASAPSSSAPEVATIGRSITIQGQVTGDEDLLIQGTVDGSVDLKQHAVTIGPDGEVKASIIGRVVMVEGRVEGNITADEQVVLRSSASVQGDITAPRVVLEDGARFRGGVDMGEPSRGGANRASPVGSSSQQGKKPRDLGRPTLETSTSATEGEKVGSEAGTGVSL